MPLPPFDMLGLDTPLQQVGGDVETLITVAAIVAQQIREELPLLEQWVGSGDCQELSKGCHRLKGSLSSIGAEEARNACVALEILAKSGSTDNLGEVMDLLRTALAKTLPELDQLAAFIST
jgi:HPt (histidine-containing phosphotransfer) domain-containing protein